MTGGMGGVSGGKIRINLGNNKHNLPSLNKNKYRKNELNVDKKTLFTDPIIELNDEEQALKYEELLEFCEAIGKCLQCGKNIDVSKFHSTPDGGIRGQCSKCLNYMVDDSAQAKALAAWLNKLLGEDYGMSFDDGLPKLVQHEKRGEWCKDCQGYHTTMQSWDYRNNEQ